MPTFVYTAPNGRKVRVSGHTAPSAQQLAQIFKQAGVIDDGPTWSDKLGLNEPTASPAIGFLRGSGAAATDMAEGAVSGLMNTAFRGGDLLRRGLSHVGGDALPEWAGGGRVIDTPEVQQAMRTPDTVSGQIGKFAEQGAEFAVPLARVSKAAAGLSWVPRMMAEGAAGAGATGVQSGGDPSMMALGAAAPAVGSVALKGGKAVVGAVRNAAAAATEDGLGGAIASVTRSALPAEPKGMLVQALKPRNTQTTFARDLSLSMPEVKATAEQLQKPINGVRDLLNVVKKAKKNVRAQYDAIAGPRRAMRAQVDLSSVADAIDASVPRKVQIQDPAKAERVRALAQTYRERPFSLDDAETLLRETNAELDAYYDKVPMAQRRSAATNPETAQLVAEAQALRKAIYDSFGDGSDAAREFQRRYGALMDLEETATRRVNVAERQQPESLSEQIGKVRAARDMAVGTWRLLHGDVSGAADIAGARAGNEAAKFLKDQQTSDALVRRAFAAFNGKPVPVSMPTQPPIAGYLPPATQRMGSGADPSYVRAVPGEFATKEVPPRKLLPAPARQMGSGADPSGVRAVEPERSVQRDPRTGRMKRVYLSTPK